MLGCVKCIHKSICGGSVEFGYLKCPHYAEDRHGYWIRSWFEEEPTIKYGKLIRRKHPVSECSECKVEIVGLIDMYYCPNCGAKMDRKDET